MYITSNDSSYPDQITYSTHSPVSISIVNHRQLTAKSSVHHPSIAWKRNRLRFRLTGLFIVAVLGLPGNIFVLYLSSTTDPPKQNGSFFNASSLLSETNVSQTTTNASLVCYENLKDIESYLELIRFWIEGVLLVSTGIIGLIGNILSLLVIFQDMKRSPFNSYLKKLCFVDGAFLVCSIFDNGFSSFTSGDFPEWYSIMYPYVFHPLKAVFMTASIYMIVAMAIDRHYAVKHPMKIRPGTDFATLVVVGIAVFYSFPKYFEFKIIRKSGHEGGLYFWTTPLNENSKYIVFNSYMELLVTGVIPLVILCLINTSIYLKIRQSSVMTGKYVVSGSQNSDRVRRRHLLRIKTEKSIGILLGIVMAFLFCQSLRLIIQLFEIITPLHGSEFHYDYCIGQERLHVPSYVFLLSHISHWLLVLNSSVNIFIYFYSSQAFQKGLLKLGKRTLSTVSSSFISNRSYPNPSTLQKLRNEETQV